MTTPLDPDVQYDLAHRFHAHPDVPVNRARIGVATRIVATVPELDPDEEPYGDVGGWTPEDESRETFGAMVIVAVGTVLVVIVLAYAAGVLIRAAWPHS